MCYRWIDTVRAVITALMAQQKVGVRKQRGLYLLEKCKRSNLQVKQTSISEQLKLKRGAPKLLKVVVVRFLDTFIWLPVWPHMSNQSFCFKSKTLGFQFHCQAEPYIPYCWINIPPAVRTQ